MAKHNCTGTSLANSNARFHIRETKQRHETATGDKLALPGLSKESLRFIGVDISAPNFLDFAGTAAIHKISTQLLDAHSFFRNRLTFTWNTCAINHLSHCTAISHISKIVYSEILLIYYTARDVVADYKQSCHLFYYHFFWNLIVCRLATRLVVFG